MMLLHSKLARESCALKNETLPHALQGEGNIQHLNSPPHGHPLLCRGKGDIQHLDSSPHGQTPCFARGREMGREFIVPGTRAGTAFPALYDTGPL